MIIETRFRPHRMFPGGHLQTLAGFYFPASPEPYDADAILLEVPTKDGTPDKIALHDDCPVDWKPDDQVVLLIHGLAGCYGSGYMSRLANRLKRAGIRTFRMDMRGTGAATGHARLPGHAGRWQDAAVAIRHIAEICPDAPLTMVGFSMGGNLALSALAAAATEPIGNLRRGIAVAPPVDLSRCCRELRVGVRNAYDKFLIRHLVQHWIATGGDLMGPRPSSIYQFDDQITAPLSGFRDAEDYYAHASSGPRLKDITLPTRILAARDDPVVAYGAIEAAERSEHVALHATDSGGHLGYVAHRSDVENRRWMDNTIEQWILQDWS